MNNKIYKKHRIIAQQFINNDDPDNKTDVDHINHNRTDNRIENLRWCSHVNNLMNKASYKGVQYEFFDEIPLEDKDDAIIEVNVYGNHEFNNLYFYNDDFYIWNGIQYRKVAIHYNNAGNAYIRAFNTSHKLITINYIKFKKLYGLI